MLQFFDVILVFDRLTRPQKLKYQVCLSYERGWFLRINSGDRYKPSVAISKADNTFLDHNSFIECGLLEIDEYEIDDALRARGIIGRVNLASKPDILAHLLSATYISPADKNALTSIFA